ncbi:hypothetical protein EG329_011668 [Mollisiaceae sp. DMI_Dod_QoI]|nr:hypothetical protein EG329_011668 [Helotiales sp. DMI_Dod_QoI]
MPTCEEPGGLNMWKTTIPSLAFECPYIYSAILAIAALHLLTLTPGDIALRAATYQYVGETVSAHRAEMNSNENSNSLNRFTTSVLLTMHAKLRTICERNTGLPYTVPVNHFMLQLGAQHLYETSEWGPEIKAYVKCYEHLAPPLQLPRPPAADHYTYLNREFPYDPLPIFVESDLSITPDRKARYLRPLTYISLIKECILTGENPSWIRHRLAIFPTRCGKEFCVLMQEEDPLSLLILARVFALLKFVDEPWWLQGTAEYEVRGLEALVPEEWKWGLEWPLEILDNSFVAVGE